MNKWNSSKVHNSTFRRELDYNNLGGGPGPGPTPSTQPYGPIETFKIYQEGAVNIGIGNIVKSVYEGGATIGACVFSASKIDLTEYSKISVDTELTNHYSNDFYNHLVVSNKSALLDPRSDSDIVKEARTNILNELVTLEVDVSDLSGEYYVGVCPIGSSSEFTNFKFVK